MKPRRGEKSSSSGSRLREDECGPDELILLLVYLYSLAAEAQQADTGEEELEKLEWELIGALTLVITQETELSPLLQNLTGEKVPLLSQFFNKAFAAECLFLPSLLLVVLKSHCNRKISCHQAFSLYIIPKL